MSFGAALVFAFAVGALVAVADALRIRGGWDVASVWRCFVADALVVVGEAVGRSVAGVTLLAATAVPWRRWLRAAPVVGGSVALAAAVGLIARQIGALPVPAPGRVGTLLVAWGVATAVFDRQHLRVAFSHWR